MGRSSRSILPRFALINPFFVFQRGLVFASSSFHSPKGSDLWQQVQPWDNRPQTEMIK